MAAALASEAGDKTPNIPMETDLIVGMALVAAALCVITFLVVWSKRSIDRIARKGYGSAREIDREETEERGEQ